MLRNTDERKSELRRKTLWPWRAAGNKDSWQNEYDVDAYEIREAESLIDDDFRAMSGI